MILVKSYKIENQILFSIFQHAKQDRVARASERAEWTKLMNYQQLSLLIIQSSGQPMLARNLFRILRQTSSTRQCLQILQLSTPTTKTQIKKRYLLMAKKYHPDSIQPNTKHSSQASKQKIQEITKLKKQFESKFVTINQAYQYLKQLSEEQINSLKNQTTKTPESTEEEKKQNKRKVSPQEIKRQQTYQYFNQKFKEDISGYPEDNIIQKERRSIFRPVPELMVGFLLLTVLLGDITYKIIKRDRNSEEGNGEEITKIEQRQIANAFKSMNHEAYFNRKTNKIEIIEG